MLPIRVLVRQRPLQPRHSNALGGVRTFKKLKPKPKPKPARKPAPKSAPKPKSTLPPPPPSLITLLSRASGPTLLYAKHSGTSLATTYTVAGMFAYICWDTYQSRIAHPPVPIPRWMRVAFYASIGTTAAFAAFFFWRPVMLLQKIYAVPTGAPGTVKFVLHRRPLVPFFPERKIAVDKAEDITLSRAMQPLGAMQPPVLLEPPAQPSAGARHLGRSVVEAPFKIFHATRSFLTGDEFVTLNVKGVGAYSLHQDGWVWEKRGIDRLFRVKAATTRY